MNEAKRKAAGRERELARRERDLAARAAEGRPVDPQRERELAKRAVDKGIVEACARRLAARFRGCAKENDLLEEGNFALQAIVREYVDGSASFESFCRRRIDWAMIDAIRVEGRHQRNDRAAQRASADLLALYRADPAATPPDRLRTLAEAVASASYAAATEESQRGGEEDIVAREEYATAHVVMKASLEAMPRKHGQLMALVYREQMSFAAAGEELGVSEDTASRWHVKALAELRKQLEKHAITHAPERGGAPRVELSVLRGDKK